MLDFSMRGNEIPWWFVSYVMVVDGWSRLYTRPQPENSSRCTTKITNVNRTCFLLFHSFKKKLNLQS